MRFEGIALRLTDLQGFFYRKAFLRAPIEYRVLPALADAEGRTQTSKRRNLLPPPGMHRHRQPGSGSELLELRDYLPGDPPKMIAWKVSARRDRLITKQFESEVPVRCTLFVDTSNAVRLGPPGANALARLVEIAAAVAQAANSNRDPVGLGLFDEDGVRYLRPLWGHRHLTEVMRRLADVAGLAPVGGEADVDELLLTAHAFAGEIYPDLLQPAINAFPAWLAWLKPPPFWTKRDPRLGDVCYGWMPWFVFLPFLSVPASMLWLAYELFWLVVGNPSSRIGPFLRFVVNGVRFCIANPLAALVVALLVGLGLVCALAVYYIILDQTSRQRRAMYRLRKELAALLSVHFGLPPDGLGLLLDDDREFTLAAQRFLAEHQVPAPLRLYDARGRYLFAAPDKIDVLAGTLLRAVGKGRDNEMFVLMADFLELTDRLGPLLRAVKVALARHHRLIVVCPWPPDLPVPPVDYKPGDLPPAIARGPVRRAAEQVVIARFHDAFHELRQTFARLGVPVVCARDGDPARMVVERLDRLRALRASSSR
jgi:hypothetical protein